MNRTADALDLRNEIDLDINVFSDGVFTNVNAASMHDIAVFVNDGRRYVQPDWFIIACTRGRAESRAFVLVDCVPAVFKCLKEERQTTIVAPNFSRGTD